MDTPHPAFPMRSTPRATAPRARRSPAALLCALALGAACTDAAVGPAPSLDASAGIAANGYTFTRIVDSRRQAFDPFGFGCPAINDAGAVAFRGRRASGIEGIFRGAGGTITRIAQDTDERFDFFGRNPSINDLGDVSFAAGLTTGEGIVRGRGGAPPTIIARTEPGPFNFFGFDTWVNDAGDVAFKAELDDFDEGLFVGRGGAGGAVTTIYLASTSQFQGTDVGPAINDRGEIAFHEDLDDFTSGIFLWTGGSFVTIATDAGPLGGFDAPSISDAGEVAFGAFLDDGSSAILKGSGGPLTPVADTNGPFAFFDFGGPSINASGVVAFTATHDDGWQGIFTGPDPAADRVIRTGERLAASRVTNLVFCRQGLNNAGQLAFAAQLADGRTVIARANPPGSVPPNAVVE
jgi:hypothetical protein